MKDDLGKKLLEWFFETGMIHVYPDNNKNGWKLHSGLWSPLYINLRGIGGEENSHNMLPLIGEAFKYLIESEIPQTTRIAGVATAGIQLAAIATLSTGIPSCYTRKLEDLKSAKQIENIKKIEEFVSKLHGEPTLVEGKMKDGDHILIVDDLITDGDSKIIAKKLVDYEAVRRKIRVTCKEVAVLIDREQGEGELEANGITSHSLIPFKSKGLGWLESSGKISSKTAKLLREYLDDPNKFQDKNYRNQWG